MHLIRQKLYTEHAQLIRIMQFAVGAMCFIILSSLSALADEPFHSNTTSNNISELQIRFFGSSSFLFEDNHTQILIDGFFTRTRHRYFRPIQPNIPQTKAMVQHAGICIEPFVSKTQKQNCKHGKTLKVIIPVHGHYDHTLDVGVLALWSRTPVVYDNSIEAVINASRELDLSTLAKINREQAIKRAKFIKHTSSLELADLGNFEIKLIRTNHLNNIVTRQLTGETQDTLSFPASIFNFKVGTNYSVWLKHRNQRILIVPTAGNITDEFTSQNLTADFVFLGIGGLGFKNQKTIETLWQNTVEATNAKSVYLIHWDSDQKAFDFAKPEFKPARNRSFSRTRKILNNIKGEVEVLYPPALSKFTP